MSTITSFKDIMAWKKAIELARLIYISSGKGLFSKDYALRDQIRRAVISISSNIAEGFERGGKREFVQFLTIAKGSTAEVQTQLRIALELGYISKGEFDQLDSVCTEIIYMISGFLRYLLAARVDGIKFKGK